MNFIHHGFPQISLRLKNRNAYHCADKEQCGTTQPVHNRAAAEKCYDVCQHTYRKLYGCILQHARRDCKLILPSTITVDQQKVEYRSKRQADTCAEESQFAEEENDKKDYGYIVDNLKQHVGL